MWERIRAHNSVVTAAVFAPKPNFFLSALGEGLRDSLINNGRVKAKISTTSASVIGNSKLESNRNGKKRY